MPGRRRLIIIAKERPFDAEKWKQLLTSFAYVLHEQRKEQDKPSPATPAKDANATRGES